MQRTPNKQVIQDDRWPQNALHNLENATAIAILFMKANGHFVSVAAVAKTTTLFAR